MCPKLWYVVILSPKFPGCSQVLQIPIQILKKIIVWKKIYRWVMTAGIWIIMGFVIYAMKNVLSNAITHNHFEYHAISLMNVMLTPRAENVPVLQGRFAISTFIYWEWCWLNSIEEAIVFQVANNLPSCCQSTEYYIYI